MNMSSMLQNASRVHPVLSHLYRPEFVRTHSNTDIDDDCKNDRHASKQVGVLVERARRAASDNRAHLIRGTRGGDFSSRKGKVHLSGAERCAARARDANARRVSTGYYGCSKAVQKDLVAEGVFVPNRRPSLPWTTTSRVRRDPGTSAVARYRRGLAPLESLAELELIDSRLPEFKIVLELARNPDSPLPARRGSGHISRSVVQRCVADFRDEGRLPPYPVDVLRSSAARFGLNSRALRSMIEAMLLIGGVESNPGPPHRTKKGRRQFVNARGYDNKRPAEDRCPLAGQVLTGVWNEKHEYGTRGQTRPELECPRCHITMHVPFEEKRKRNPKDRTCLGLHRGNAAIDESVELVRTPLAIEAYHTQWAAELAVRLGADPSVIDEPACEAPRQPLPVPPHLFAPVPAPVWPVGPAPAAEAAPAPLAPAAPANQAVVAPAPPPAPAAAPAEGAAVVVPRARSVASLSAVSHASAVALLNPEDVPLPADTASEVSGMAAAFDFDNPNDGPARHLDDFMRDVSAFGEGLAPAIPAPPPSSTASDLLSSMGTETTTTTTDPPVSAGIGGSIISSASGVPPVRPDPVRPVFERSEDLVGFRLPKAALKRMISEWVGYRVKLKELTVSTTKVQYLAENRLVTARNVAPVTADIEIVRVDILTRRRWRLFQTVLLAIEAICALGCIAMAVLPALMFDRKNLGVVGYIAFWGVCFSATFAHCLRTWKRCFTKRRRLSIPYAPHLISTVLNEFSANAGSSVDEGAICQKLLRAACLPIPDSIATQISFGSEIAIKACLREKSFFEVGAPSPP